MKFAFCVFILLLTGLKSFEQTKQIDSLIRMLHNNEIKPDGNYFGPTYYLSNGPAVKLITIGKAVTVGLLNVLTDSSKGVVAHLILTELWKDSFPGVNPIHIDRDDITIFTVDGLTFFIKGDQVYANRHDLEMNLVRWKEFVRNDDILGEKRF